METGLAEAIIEDIICNRWEKTLSMMMYLARLTCLTKIKDTKDHARLSTKCSSLDSNICQKLRLKSKPFLEASY